MGKPFPGPKVPHRTPRKRALEVGTDSGAFIEGVPYDPVAGTPDDVSGGRATAPMPVGATPSSSPSNPSPFKLGPQ